MWEQQKASSHMQNVMIVLAHVDIKYDYSMSHAFGSSRVLLILLMVVITTGM